MKNLYLAFLLLLSFALLQTANAQSWSYVNTDEYFADANDVIEDADGNIIVCGGGGSWPYVPDGDVRITKLDAAGNLLWEYEFTSPATIGSITANDIALAADGYVAFCSGFEKPLIIKVNTDGTLAWTSESWCTGLVDGSVTRAFGNVASDGSMLFASVDGSTYMNFNIYKVASGGSLLTSNSYPLYDGFFGTSIIDAYGGTGTSDGGLAICGDIAITGTVAPYIWKFDSDGNEEWRSDLTGYNGTCYGIKQTSDGGYAVTAGNPFEYTSTLIKTDADGVALWGADYAATSVDYMPYAEDVAELADGSYVLAVNNYDNTYIYYGAADVIFIDASGVETSRITVAGGEEITGVNTINATADGGYALCGWFGMDDYMSGAWDSRFYAQKSDADGNLPACVYNCVWPGDGDNNGVANADDILSIGLSYGNTGDARDDMSIGWYAHAANAWTTTLPDGTNNKYTDGNGDGTINDDDTAAVVANYANEHAVYSLKTTAGVPLYVEDPGVVLNGGPHELKIRLGDAATSIDAIYGLRFTIQFEGESIAPESVSVHFDNSWIGAETEMIQFKKLFADTYQIDAALVKTDLLNSDGYGDIGTLSFVLVDNIAGKESEMEELTFTIANVRAIDVDMNEIEIAAMTTTVNADAVSVDDVSENTVSLYPNPASGDFIFIDAKTSPLSMHLYDVSGKFLKAFSQNEITAGKLNISGFAQGTYQLKIQTQEGTSTQKLLIAR